MGDIANTTGDVPPEQAEIVLKLRGHVPSSIMDAPDPAAAGQGDAAAAGKPKKK